jgi:hypothetical protein
VILTLAGGEFMEKMNVFVISIFSLIHCQFPSWYQNMVVSREGEIKIVFGNSLQL